MKESLAIEWFAATNKYAGFRIDFHYFRNQLAPGKTWHGKVDDNQLKTIRVGGKKTQRIYRIRSDLNRVANPLKVAAH